MRLCTPGTLLLLSPALLSQRFPEIEPNDTAATAQFMVVGSQIDSNLVAAEQDWYRFVLTAAARIRMHTNATDTRIAVCDATGTTYLGIDDDSRPGFFSDITMNLAAGSYTVQVVGFTTTTTGVYQMEVSRITTMVYDGSELEPNENHTTATPTGVAGPGVRRLHGNLGAATVVFTDSVAVPAIPPVVFSGAVSASMIVFTGSVLVTPASTTTSIQTIPGQPAANPLLASYQPAMSLVFTVGVNNGVSRTITSNTGVSITTAAFPAAPAGGDPYHIVTGPNTLAVTWVNSLPLASLYVASNGYTMRMTNGANAGLSRAITANTGPSAFGSAITTAAFPVANAPGDTFDIDAIGGSGTVFRTTGALTNSIWNPTTGGLGLGNFQVRFTSGANIGQVRQISGNTAASITLVTALTAALAAGDTFVVEQCDLDYWRVTLTAPFTGIWFQINEGNAPWVFGHRYEIFDASGNALLPAASQQLPGFGTQAATSSSLTAHTSQIRVWPAGTYYIEVRSPPTPFVAATTMPNGVVPTGNYLLEIFTMPMDTGSTVTEAEPVSGPNVNNTPATAEPLAPGQVGRGNVTISTGTDPSDWWGPIAINGPVTITCQVRRFGTAQPLLDSTVNLRSTTGALLVTATGGNVLDVPSTSTTGLHGRVTLSFFVAQGNVFIEVLSPGTTQAGDYELEISSIIAAPYVTSSYTISAANAACGVAPFPALTRQHPSEVPALGSTFSRQLTGCPPAAIFFLFQGLSTTLANGVTPLPFDLTPNGAPGCTINVDPTCVVIGVCDATGTAELQNQLSGNVALRGVFFSEQVLVMNASANPLGVQVSNFARLIFGERTY